MLPRHEVPTHLHVEDRVFFGFMTVRHVLVLAAGSFFAMGAVFSPPLPLPEALRYLCAALIVAAAAAVAFIEPDGRKMEDWLLAVARYLTSPRVAVWLPSPLPWPEEGEKTGVLVLGPGADRWQQARTAATGMTRQPASERRDAGREEDMSQDKATAWQGLDSPAALRTAQRPLPKVYAGGYGPWGGGPMSISPVQALLPIADVRDRCLVLRGGHVRGALEARPVNFTLRPPAEQEAMVASFRSFLHALAFPIQVVVRSMPAPIDDYLAELRAGQGKLLSPELRRLAVEHEAFVRRLAQERTILERRIYVVVPAEAPGLEAAAASPLRALLRPGRKDEAAQLAAERVESAVRLLETRMEQVLAGLLAIGIPCRRLSGAEMLAVLHDFLGSSAPFPEDIAAELLPVHVGVKRGASRLEEVRGSVLPAV